MAVRMVTHMHPTPPMTIKDQRPLPGMSRLMVPQMTQAATEAKISSRNKKPHW